MLFLMDTYTFCLSTRSADGQAGVLHVGAVGSNAAVKAPVCWVFGSLRWTPPSGIAGSCGNTGLSILGNGQTVLHGGLPTASDAGWPSEGQGWEEGQTTKSV